MKKLLLLTIVLITLIIFPDIAQATIESFYVDPDYDISKREEVEAILKLVSPYARFYVEEEYLNSLSRDELDLFNPALKDLSSEFNETIYPKMTAVYGSAGVEKVTILATPMKEGFRGYFQEGNEEMVYLNASDITSDLAPAYLAHEFQHLINYNQKTRIGEVTEEKWLNEALSEYAPTLCGYNDTYEDSYLSGRIKDFIRSPYDPLGEWRESAADYASVSLFMHYLVGRFGQDLIGEMMSNGLTGIASVEEGVNEILRSAQNDAEMGFEEIFADWTVANYLNDPYGGCRTSPIGECGIPETSYRYAYNPDCCGKITFDRFHLPTQVTYGIYPSSETGSSFMVKDWAGSWYKFIPSGRLGPARGDSLSIEFTSDDYLSDFRGRVIISDFEGNNEVRDYYIKDGQGKFYVPDFGWKVAQVVFIPFNGFKRSDFSIYDPRISFSFTARSERTNTIDGNLWPEGSLIRAEGRPEVYIVKDGFKRWIQTPQVFNMYGHFRWEDIIEAPEINVSSYQNAWLIRKAGDYKVYEVNADGTKHWLNMTAEEFEVSGRKWGMVYEVNEEEFKWYETGSDVLIIAYH